MEASRDRGSAPASLLIEEEGGPARPTPAEHKSADVILVATDFDDTSTKALLMANALASRLKAEIVLMHVCPLPVYSYVGFDGMATLAGFGRVREAASRSLQNLAASTGNVRSILRDGDPAQEILAAVGELDPSMVVMGTHGRQGLEHWLLGSVAEQVVRGSKVPVLTVPL
jgi:nucleotide-binding universal stress UspA family protein